MSLQSWQRLRKGVSPCFPRIFSYLLDHWGQEVPDLRVDLGQERPLQELFLRHLQDQVIQVSLRRDVFGCQPCHTWKVLI